MVVAAWAVKPTCTIVPVEAAWWRSETAAPTPPTEMTMEFGVAAAAAGVDESRMIATPQQNHK